jgi:hypothetical protein
MSEETANNEQVAAPTPEQLTEYRNNMLQYYKNETPLLEAQLDYERLVADIEEARVKALTMVIRQAQLKAGPPKEAPITPSPERQERKLKAE